MNLPAIEDLDVEGRRVLVRADLNVPLQEGAVGDDMRIRAAIPTIESLLARGARIVLCSHLGRPKGKIVEDMRLAPVAARLEEVVGREVIQATDVVGDEAERFCSDDGIELVMLENLRFEPGEESNDPSFADRLTRLATAYVNDAFGAAHRAHASVVGPPERLPSAAGLLLQEEVQRLERVLAGAESPFVAVLGGAKVSDKLGVITNLLERVDVICVGGAMAFTVLAARDEPVGRSRVEADRISEVKEMLAAAHSRGVEVLLPDDVVAADGIEPGAPHEVAVLAAIGDRMGVDIGPSTTERFTAAIGRARTILWNGPMGIFENDDYAAGTEAVARAIASATQAGAYSVAGGGDSAAALAKFGLDEAVSHLSTGGGASLEFLEGKELPGIAALAQAQTKRRPE